MEVSGVSFLFIHFICNSKLQSSKWNRLTCNTVTQGNESKVLYAHREVSKPVRVHSIIINKWKTYIAHHVFLDKYQSFVILNGSDSNGGCFGKPVLTHASYIACVSFHMHAFLHIKHVKQLTALVKNFSLKQYLPWHSLFCLLHMRISEGKWHA